MNKQRLLQKYLNEEYSTEELLLLYKYLQKDDVEEYHDIMYKIWGELELHSVQSLGEATAEKIYEKLISRINKAKENK